MNPSTPSPALPGPEAARSAAMLPALSIEQVLEPHAPLIERIRICYGTDRETFEREVLRLVENFTRYVHLLPANARGDFSEPGGLLRLGLETAFFSLQGTDARIFSGRATLSLRRVLEPRWRLATFLGGMCSELHRALRWEVHNPDGRAWPAFLRPLSGWLSDAACSHFRPRWREGPECRSTGLFVLSQVVAPGLLQHLSEANTVIVPHLLACVGGTSIHGEHNVLDELVRRSLALVLHREALAQGDSALVSLAPHWTRYLVDAMQRLSSQSPTWTVNRERSRVWLGSDGMFLVWPSAAEDIRQLLDLEQIPGNPASAGHVRDCLIAANVFLPSPPGQGSWSIWPPGARSAVEAMKVAQPALLLDGLTPAPTPLDQRLTSTGAEDSAPRPSSQPAKASPAAGDAQLSLLTQAPSDSSSAAGARQLDAPLRLNVAVRNVLLTALADASGEELLPVDAGWFIPLSAFERRGVPPTQAVRALLDAGMLAPHGESPPSAITLEVGGRSQMGVVLASRCVHEAS